VRTALCFMVSNVPDDGEQVATETALVIWLSCGGCEGCTMSVLGATSPRLEELLAGGLTHIQGRIYHLRCTGVGGSVHRG